MADPVAPPVGDGAESRLFVLWSARHSRSPAELERWARAQLPCLRNARGVRAAWLRRVAAPSPSSATEWSWAYELRVSDEAVGELCDRGPCGELLADMRLMGMRPVAVLLRGDEG